MDIFYFLKICLPLLFLFYFVLVCLPFHTIVFSHVTVSDATLTARNTQV